MRPPSTTMAAADLKQHLNFGHNLGPQGPQGIPHGHLGGHGGHHGVGHGVVNGFERSHGVHGGHHSQHSVNNQQIQVSSGHLNNGHYSNSNGNGNHSHQNPANQTLSSFTQVNSTESVFHYKCVFFKKIVKLTCYINVARKETCVIRRIFSSSTRTLLLFIVST